MVRQWIGLSVAIALLGAAATADAGYKATSPVYIDTTSRLFLGAFGSARSSADSTQYIQMQSSGYTSSSEFVAFAARNAAGTTATCYSYSANILSASKALTSDSYIQVQYDANGVCTAIYVFNGSYFEPKTL